ncbi:hypothetical protein P43SY_011192 [Pythium insidiosum]|uniref:Uncharacterized protein n=1 Tax=Pythium insidiosum TaxID=114742 RepID=A0AAD5LQM9_PYTIN|nr:hypothetical protein P43SY_011192 [Pythium insidiosum]
MATAVSRVVANVDPTQCAVAIGNIAASRVLSLLVKESFGLLWASYHRLRVAQAHAQAQGQPQASLLSPRNLLHLASHVVGVVVILTHIWLRFLTDSQRKQVSNAVTNCAYGFAFLKCTNGVYDLARRAWHAYTALPALQRRKLLLAVFALVLLGVVGLAACVWTESLPSIIWLQQIPCVVTFGKLAGGRVFQWVAQAPRALLRQRPNVAGSSLPNKVVFLLSVVVGFLPGSPLAAWSRGS